MTVILRILCGIGGVAMFTYGGYGLATAVRNPSLRMYFSQRGSDMVQLLGHDVRMSTRLFVILVYLFVFVFIAGGLWLCGLAFRGKGDHAG